MNRITKAVSLTQPWATLVAIGAKRIETRSWRTEYRGPIAMHASKGFPKSARETCGDEPFRSELERAGVRFSSSPPRHWYHSTYPYQLASGLPLGAIVAVARLTGCVPTHEVLAMSQGLLRHEIDFGDYGDGRSAWLLADVVRLPDPIPCRGALGL